jgi:protein SCO1/2
MSENSAAGPEPTSSAPCNRVMLRTWSGILWLLVLVSLLVMFLTPQSQPDIRQISGDKSGFPGFHRPVELDPEVELVTRKVADFTMTERSGTTVTRDDLLGKPWVVNFIFTSCVMTCPANTTAMMKLAEQSKNVDVRFVTITVDPERDTPQRLSDYAEIYGADADQWWFLTGEKEEIHQLILKNFLQVVEEQQGKNRLLGYEFAHTDRVLHIAADGTILGQYLSTDPLEMTKLRRVLAGETETPARNRFLVAKSGELASEPEESLKKPSPETQPEEPADPIAPEATEDEKTDEKADVEVAPLTGETSVAVENQQQFAFEQAEIALPVPAWIERLPTINALLNSLATLLLLAGYMFIRRKQIIPHRNCMLSAFAVSILFLATYLTYHFGLHAYTGESSKKFPDLGFIRQVYYVILISHILLAVAVPVLAVTTLVQAGRQRWEQHRFWASITFPIWLYVSVTGVIIYWMLYHLVA